MHRLAEQLRWMGKRARDAVAAARSVALGLGGLSCIDLAVWRTSVTWGLVAVGLSLLLVQYLTEGSGKR
jgi:hypothetical protein